MSPQPTMTNEDRNVFLEHLGCWTLAVEYDLPTEWYVPAEHDSYWDACRAAMSAVNENRAARGVGAVKATELARVEWKRRAEWLAHERGETPAPPRQATAAAARARREAAARSRASGTAKRHQRGSAPETQGGPLPLPGNFSNGLSSGPNPKTRKHVAKAGTIGHEMNKKGKRADPPLADPQAQEASAQTGRPHSSLCAETWT